MCGSDRAPGFVQFVSHVLGLKPQRPPGRVARQRELLSIAASEEQRSSAIASRSPRFAAGAKRTVITDFPATTWPGAGCFRSASLPSTKSGARGLACRLDRYLVGLIVCLEGGGEICTRVVEKNVEHLMQLVAQRISAERRCGLAKSR